MTQYELSKILSHFNEAGFFFYLWKTTDSNEERTRHELSQKIGGEIPLQFFETKLF